MPDKKIRKAPKPKAPPKPPEFWPGALKRYRLLFAYHILWTGCVLMAAVLTRVLLVWRYIRVGNPLVMLPVVIFFGQMLNCIKFMEFHAECQFDPRVIAGLGIMNFINMWFLVAFGYPYMSLFAHGVLTLTVAIILFMAQCFTAAYYIFEIQKKMGIDPWKKSKKT